MFLRAQFFWSFFALTAASLAPATGLAAPTGMEIAAREKTEKSDKLLTADEITNDDNSGTVIARGNVEIATPEHILQAHEVEYDKPKDIVVARGDVALQESDGTVLFAKETRMSSDMLNGAASDVGLLMTDNSRFAATDARRADGRYMLFSHGLFSPCNLCKEDRRKAPLWQVRAAKITHDNVTHDVIYRDATLEMFGIPAFYTPYFTHPDPTVKRRQGLLSPSYGNNPDVGHFVTLPYYFDIAADIDYTFYPTFSGEDGVRVAGNLRKRWEKGDLNFKHSFVIADRKDEDGRVKKDQIRGHIAGNFVYNIDPVFRTGADFFVQTDKIYMRRYNEGADDVLTNRVYLEGFEGRHFGALEFFYFQDNRPSPRPEQPLVLPRLRFSGLGEPGQTFGGRWSLDGIVTALRRENGTDTRKFGVEAGWERREVLPLGLVGTLRGSVRDDIFWVGHLPDPTTPGRIFNGETANRIFPQGQALLSYPLMQDFGSFSHVVEPITAISVAPTRDLNPRIPNEDSQDLEFDTTNLFELNRYPGSDQMEQGARATYGLHTGFYGHEGGMAEFIFGQNARITPDPLFPKGSGLETGFSDYVGQARLEPGDWLSLNYIFRLDRDAENFRKHDARVSVGIPEFRPFANYINFTPPATAVTGVGSVEEITFGFSSQFLDYWSFSASRTNDLREGFTGPRNTHFDVTYSDECFRTSFSFTRDETRRTGVNSGDIYFFTIYFKHLGGIDR